MYSQCYVTHTFPLLLVDVVGLVLLLLGVVNPAKSRLMIIMTAGYTLTGY